MDKVNQFKSLFLRLSTMSVFFLLNSYLRALVLSIEHFGNSFFSTFTRNSQILNNDYSPTQKLHT